MAPRRPAPADAGAPAALSVRGVSHAFGRLKALDDVSLHIPQGRFATLVGVNGAGKTTLFSLITRLYDNVSGSIEVAGFDVRRRSGEALARTGVVFQSLALDLALTLRQNLRYHAALHGLAPREARLRGDALLERVELLDRADARAATLSGGQRRRVEIVRALIHEPRLLLLDEPTAGLDARARQAVIALVRTLVAEDGVSVLWATHLLDEIAPADTVIVLHEGRVRARGSAAGIAGGRRFTDAFLDLTGAEQAEIAP